MNFVVRTPLRLNLENPEQAEIYQVMKNLNRDIYKSQNQFIVEALKHYINYSGADTLTEQEESEKRKYVTVEEQELMKEELKEELDKEKMRIQEKDAEIAALKAELEAHKAQQTDQKS